MDFNLLTVGSVLFDAVFVPGGMESVKALKADAMAVLFVNEAYKHCKALAATGEGIALFPNHNGADRAPAKVGALAEGVVVSGDGDVARVAAELVKALARHRAWSREKRRASTCRPDGTLRQNQSSAPIGWAPAVRISSDCHLAGTGLVDPGCLGDPADAWAGYTNRRRGGMFGQSRIGRRSWTRWNSVSPVRSQS